MPSITLDGDEIHFDDIPGPTGDAPVIVWAHGFLMSARFYREAIEALPGYRHVIVDHRGHGRSASVESDATLARMADDLHGVVSSLGIERFFFVGHSMGSAVGWHLAAEHPGAIAAGVSIAGIPVIGKLAESRPWVAGMIEMAGQEDAMVEMLGGVYKQLDPSGDHVRAVGAGAALVPRECIREIVTNQFYVDQRDTALGALSQPWLFLVPGEDLAEPPEYQVAQSKLLPRASCALIEGAGHMLPQEQPEVVAGHIASFLGPIALR